MARSTSRAPETMDNLTISLFCYVAPGWSVAMGLLGLYGEMRSVREAMASRRWRQTDGIIRGSQIAPESTAPAVDQLVTNTCLVPVTYDYEVDGENFTGNRIFLTHFSTSHQPTMRSILAPYAEGARVVVFYDPADPVRSVLQPGFHWPTWLALAGGFFLILFGVLWAVAANRFLK